MIALSTITAGGLVSSALSPSIAMGQQPTWSPQPFVPAQQATAPTNIQSVENLPTNSLRSQNNSAATVSQPAPVNAPSTVVRNNSAQSETPMAARWRKVETLTKQKSEVAAFETAQPTAPTRITIKQPTVQSFVAANAANNSSAVANTEPARGESFDRFENGSAAQGAKQQIVLRASHEAIESSHNGSRVSSKSPMSDSQVVSASYNQNTAPANSGEQWYSRSNRVAPPPANQNDAAPSVSKIRPSARPVATSGYGGQEPPKQGDLGAPLPAFPPAQELPPNAAPPSGLQLQEPAPNNAATPLPAAPKSLLENDPPRTSPFPEPTTPLGNGNAEPRSPSDSIEPPAMNRNDEYDLPPAPPSRTDRGALDCDKYRQAANISIQRVRVDSSPAFVEGYKNRDSLNSKSAFAQTSPSRPWHSQSGELVTEGRLVDLAFGSAVIELADGTQKTVLLRKLSDADQVYIAESWGVPVTCTLGNQNFYRRDFVDSTVTWKATAACHKPLYFEEVQLERYGHEFGPFVQPAISTAHFFGNVAVLPYKMGIHPPNECQYSLGYYRPGSCAPWTLGPVPISLRGALMQAKVATGAALALP